MTSKNYDSKNSVVIKGIIWAVSIALIVFYLAIFYLGFNRKSCLEYELVYYQGVYFENWPGANGIDYETGTTENRTQEKFINRRGGGWNTSIGDEMWTAGLDSYLMYHFTDAAAGKRTIDIYVEALADEDINAAVYVNDEKVIDKLQAGHNKGTFNYDASVDLYTVVIKSDKVVDVNKVDDVIAVQADEAEEVVTTAEEVQPVMHGVKIYSITID